MGIVGFNYLKIEAVKRSSPSGKINVNNNVSINDVRESELSLGAAKQKGITFHFEFSTVYEPEVGRIVLGGEVVYIGTETEVKNVLKGWKDKKEIPKKLSHELLNLIITKCNIFALGLSQDINLPPPVQLPRIAEEN